MEETLELLRMSLPCINATPEKVSRPPFSFIRLAIESLGLTPPSMPFSTEVNFDKREKLVFMIKTLASVDELLKRSISSVVSVSEVIAGKSPPITMYMLRSLVEVSQKNTLEQIQSTVRLVDLKDLADCFGQSLKRRKTLVKAAAILKGGAVRLRLKQLGSQKLRCQSTINSELPQTRTCPTVDTIKTPIVNVTKVTQAPTTRVHRHTQRNYSKGPSQQQYLESLAQRELELQKREERVQRTAEALRREQARVDRKQKEDRMTLLRQVQQERHAAEGAKRDAERMMKQARRHRQAALRSESSIADRPEARYDKLKRGQKKQTPRPKRIMPITQASKGAAALNQKTSVSPRRKDSHQPPRNNLDEKNSVKEHQEKGSHRPNQSAVSNHQPACRTAAAPPIFQETPIPVLSTGQEEPSKNEIHHSKSPQSKPEPNKTSNEAVVETNINKSRSKNGAETFDMCHFTTEEESRKKKIQINRRCSSACVRAGTTEKNKCIEKGGPVSDVSRAKPPRNTNSQDVGVKQRPKTAIGSGGRKGTSKVVVQEVGDAMTWISDFDKKLSHVLSDLEEADCDGQFTNMELSPTGQVQLCTN